MDWEKLTQIHRSNQLFYMYSQIEILITHSLLPLKKTLKGI